MASGSSEISREKKGPRDRSEKWEYAAEKSGSGWNPELRNADHNDYNDYMRLRRDR